jgi:PAS domain S-box-containing protein
MVAAPEERRIKQLEQLAAVLAAVGAAPDLRAALAALAKGAISLLDGDQGAVRLYDAEGPGKHFAFWVAPDGALEPAGNADPPPGSVVAELRAGGPGRVIDDLWRLGPSRLPSYAEIRRRGLRSSVAVPIDAAGTRIGSLHVDHHTAGFFTAADLAVAAALAAQAGVVIERARQEARRGAEQALRLSERRYRTLMEQSPLSTQVFTPDGTILAANTAWERLWGVPRETLEGYNILHDEQFAAKGVLPLIERAFAGEAVRIPAVSYDPAEIGRAGRARWVRAACYPLKDEAGTIVEVVLVLEDVTAQREARAALEAREARLRRLAEHAQDFIYRYDFLPRRGFSYASPACERIFGYTPEEFLADPDIAHRMVIPEDSAEVQHTFGGQDVPAHATLRYRRKDGGLVWIEFRRVPIYAADGTLVAFEGIARDVTARAEAEAERVRLLESERAARAEAERAIR